MNVVIVNCFDTYEYRVDLLHNFFENRGDKVIVYTSTFRHFEKVERTDNKENFVYIKANPYYKNMSTQRLWSHHKLSKDIFKDLSKENLDLLWVLIPPNSFTKDAANYKKKHPNTKLVFDVIDMWPETMPVQKIKNLPPIKAWGYLRNKWINVADHVVTECELYQTKLVNYVDKSKMTTVYLAREIKEFKGNPNPPEDKTALCYLGSINNIIDISTIGVIVKEKETVWFLWEIEMARKKRNQFDVDEIYRGLRTNIEFSQMDDAIQVINVVSTIPNEGKSTIACNLARIMAAKYKNVLLIDCDLRNASVHKTLQISNRSGLTNIISEFREGVSIHSFEGVQDVQYDGGYPLSVITAGHRVPNPSEVLGSKRLAKFLNQARQEFGYIIIDCPPVAVASDAIPLCNVSDGVLYVVDAKSSDKRKVKAAINDVERNGGHVMGVVLNKVESASDSNYGYGYGYGYGGEDNGKKKKKK